MGENYWTHAWFALRFGSLMLLAGFALIVHAIFPFLFVDTGRKLLVVLNRAIDSRQFIFTDKEAS